MPLNAIKTMKKLTDKVKNKKAAKLKEARKNAGSKIRNTITLKNKKTGKVIKIRKKQITLPQGKSNRFRIA